MNHLTQGVKSAIPTVELRYFDYPGTRRNHLIGAVRQPTALHAYLVRLGGPDNRPHRRLQAVPAEMAKFLTAALALPGRAQGLFPAHPEIFGMDTFRRVEFERPRGPRRKTNSRQGQKPQPTAATVSSSTAGGTRRDRGAGRAASHTPAPKPVTVPAPDLLGGTA